MINLTLNALDAVDRGGKVRIVLAPLSDRVRLAVYDSGAGVRAEVADSLFEPFSTTKPEGIGLGLAVAARIVAAHGGQLTWTRSENETCFELMLLSQQLLTANDGRLDVNTNNGNPNHARAAVDGAPTPTTASKEPLHA